MDKLELLELIRQVKERVAAMTPEQRAEMHRQQREGMVRAEMQRAKNYRLQVTNPPSL